MVIRPSPERPMIFAVGLADWQGVDARKAAAHQATLVELPIFVAVGPEPIATVVVPLISEAHRDAILVEGPQLLDQAVVQLTIPFTCQERLDLVTALHELRPVPPSAVQCVGERHALGITAVPGILGKADLLGSFFNCGEGRQWWTFRFHHHSPLWWPAWCRANQFIRAKLQTQFF